MAVIPLAAVHAAEIQALLSGGRRPKASRHTAAEVRRNGLLDGLPSGSRPLMSVRADECAPVDVTATFATLFECARAGLGFAAVGAVMYSSDEGRHVPQARDRV